MNMSIEQDITIYLEFLKMFNIAKNIVCITSNALVIKGKHFGGARIASSVELHQKKFNNRYH